MPTYIYTLQCSFGAGPVYGQALMIAAKGTKGDSRGEDETHASKFKAQEYWFRFSGIEARCDCFGSIRFTNVYAKP